jgi:WD repeat-containing protein 55
MSMSSLSFFTQHFHNSNNKKNHSDAINCMLTLNENLFATGDESGIIKLWDERTHEAVQTYSENSDFVADMEFIPHKKTLLAAW